MNKKDILELKRRFKKNHCTITRMCGCYVNAEKEILLTLGENACLCDNVVGIVEHENQVISGVLVIVDDQAVKGVEQGFVFQAAFLQSHQKLLFASRFLLFAMYYTKDAKAPHPEFMEMILGCPVRQTAAEQRNTFQDIVHSAVPEERRRERVLYDIHETIHDMLEERALCTDPEEEPEPILLTAETIQEVLAASKIPEEVAARIEGVQRCRHRLQRFRQLLRPVPGCSFRRSTGPLYRPKLLRNQ